MKAITASLLFIFLLLPTDSFVGNSPIAAELELESRIRVRTAEVDFTPVGGSKQATGQVAAYRKATVAAEAAGRIIERFAEPGRQLAVSDTLVRIDPERAQLNLEQAKALHQARAVDLAHAEHEYKRAIDLYRRKVVSQDTLDDLRFAEQGARAQLTHSRVQISHAQRALEDTVVKTPYAAQVEQVHVQVGDYVNPGQPIATITDFSSARVIAGVTAAEAASLTLNDSAKVVFEALGGLHTTAQITGIGRIKDPTSGTYPIEIAIKGNITQQLREGMVSTVIWSPSQHTGQRLTIPTSALLRQNGGISVYVVNKNLTVTARPVQIGNSDGRRVEILEGIQAAEHVVVEGLFALRDGAKVAPFGSFSGGLQ